MFILRKVSHFCNSIYNQCVNNPRMAIINNNYQLFVSSYILIAFALYCSDIVYYEKYKDKKITKMSLVEVNALYRKYFPLVAFNLFITTYLCGFFNYLLMERFNPKLIENNTLDTFQPSRALLEYIVCYYIADITFYSCHRLVHSKRIYKYIHKTHHKVIDNIGMAGIYTDPLDFIISNYAPLMIHTTMIMTHQYSLMVWSVMTVIGVVFTSHSGYDKISNFHDNHHKSFNYNFGLDNFMDKYFKTRYPHDFKSNIKNVNDVNTVLPVDPMSNNLLIKSGTDMVNKKYDSDTPAPFHLGKVNNFKKKSKYNLRHRKNGGVKYVASSLNSEYDKNMKEQSVYDKYEVIKKRKISDSITMYDLNNDKRFNIDDDIKFNDVFVNDINNSNK